MPIASTSLISGLEIRRKSAVVERIRSGEAATRHRTQASYEPRRLRALLGLVAQLTEHTAFGASQCANA